MSDQEKWDLNYEAVRRLSSPRRDDWYSADEVFAGYVERQWATEREDEHEEEWW